MKRYLVNVHNFIHHFNDSYEVFACSPAQAKKETLNRIFIETDFDIDEFEVIRITEIKES